MKAPVDLYGGVTTRTAAGGPLMGAIDVDGANIRYRVWDGAGDSAPGLLFLAGYRAHAHWWDHIVPYFTDDYRVASMDFSGFGDSDWRETYTAKTFAREILAVTDAAGLAPVTIVAHSFSGTPTVHACKLAPEKLRRAIIIDTRMMIRGIPDPSAAELSLVGSKNKLFPSREDILGRFRLLPPSDAVSPALVDYIAHHAIREVEGGWAWKFDARLDPQLSTDPDRMAPEDIATPLDYMYGDRSNVVTPAFAETIVNSFGTCGRAIIIPESDHHVLLEQPVALVAALRALLARDAV